MEKAKKQEKAKMLGQRTHSKTGDVVQYSFIVDCSFNDIPR